MSDAPPPPLEDERYRDRDDRGPPRSDRSRERDPDRRDRDYDRRDRDGERHERSHGRREDSRERGDRQERDERRPSERGDFRRSDSRRSRSPRDDSPPRRRRRGWDDMGANPENAALLLQQQAAFANMHTVPTAALAGSKKQRELYIGNLPPTANEHMLKELFAHLVSACDGFNPALGPPVLNAQMAGGGQFAFVEFRDEQLAETAMLFNGIDLAGRQLKIGHPNGYLTPAQPVLTLKLPPELLAKFGISHGAGAASTDRPAGVSQETKKQRELYIGNLAVGMVTPPMLKELFTLPLEKLATGGMPPVMEARVDANGKFAFVEFCSEELCTTALTLFNGMELCGREMKIARPAGYIAPPGGAPGIPGLLPPMPTLPHGFPPVPPPGLPPGMPPGMPHIPPGGTGLPSMAALGASAAADRPIPTRELRLTNLLSASVLADPAEYEECVEDIKGAVEEHGAVAAFRCPKEGEPDAGTCFVRYEHIASAVKAYEALNGRDFDGNTVQASFLPPGSI